MRYAIWNNKGGVGKTFLSFVLGTEFAYKNPNKNVLLVDMCPQANLSEVLLGGNGFGSDNLNNLLSEGNITSNKRQTIGGYFDERISSPQTVTGSETSYLIKCWEYNSNLPNNIYLLAGDPSLEIQAQVISQISSQSLPQDSWKNVHLWLKDLVVSCENYIGDTVVFIDCNPSFSAYTELAMLAADRVLIPCSSDGSSARAIDNIGALLYGKHKIKAYEGVGFHAKATSFKIPIPKIGMVFLNRSTQYDKRSSKAFAAMFQEIKVRVGELKNNCPTAFVKQSIDLFFDVPDNHSVAIVASHQGKPLYSLHPGKYSVHEENPQINKEPLDRYKESIQKVIESF